MLDYLVEPTAKATYTSTPSAARCAAPSRPGWHWATPRHPDSQGKGDEKGNGKDKADPCAEEETTAARASHSKGQEKSQAHKKLKLAESTTSYLYDGLGLNVLKEYKGLSASKAEYYYANGQVLGRKMRCSPLPRRPWAMRVAGKRSMRSIPKLRTPI